MSKEARRRYRDRYVDEHGVCQVCGVRLVKPSDVTNGDGKMDRKVGNMAVLKQRFSRYNKAFRECNYRRGVVMCHNCANRISAEEECSVPIDERRERSGNYGNNRKLI